MRFGLQKLTLLDYPGQLACTVFTCGCNFRCPFCHNAALVTGDPGALEYSFAEILEFLENRGSRLEGICLTGGEPLLHEESILLMQAAKAMGYKVKLDTNGSFPERLAEVLAENAVDYVAMDIKNSPAKYDLTSGTAVLEKVRRSVGLLKNSNIEYEFRTTVTGNLHEKADFTAIGQWLAGTERYFLQGFKDSGDILAGDAADFAVSDEKLAEFLDEARKFIPAAAIRGR
ncbi:MAG: anaerobic ribonucleoside-triphosphate reductase activating protein [Lentisphaerae bacterium]|nr:anaerobic ribonucleoside-triphosphate reductase activating protein [Lentisphaerota bacterium]